MTKRNLIIIHRGPEYERDFDEIAMKVNALDGETTVYHLPANLKVELPVGAWQHPTLTVALSPTFRLPIQRGPVLKNVAIEKLTQQDLFRQHGILTPPALPFRFGMKLDPILFGELVVLKTVELKFTSTGENITLMRRRRAEQLTASGLAMGHPLRLRPQSFMVQRFVDTGECIKYNRVTSFLGAPLWCNEALSSVARPPLSSSDSVLERIAIANLAFEKRRYRFHADADVLAIAKRVHDALPQVPLLGIDILREERTGKLFVLECNSGGNGWHFSSRGAASFREEIGLSHGYSGKPAEDFGRKLLIDQFDAFTSVAELLVRKTHALAA